MPEIGTQVILILLLIAVNGLLAMSEIAVVSARKARLRQRADAGNAGAATALALAEEPTRFLSTVQVGITLVGIFAGAFGGATIAEELAQVVAVVPVLAPYSSAISLGLVVATITYLSLILGELVPKRIGLTHAEAIAAIVAQPMRTLSSVAGPLVSLLSLSTEAVLRVLRVQPSTDSVVTEDDVRIMIAEGTARGVFQPAEREIVESVFRFGDRRVDELMVPRPRILWLDVEDPPDTNWKQIAASSHSYYPVARGGLDQLLGVVSIRRLSSALLAGQRPDLEASVLQPTVVPESMTAPQLLELFRTISPRIVFVVDEHGTIIGLVTPTDILEAIVGDLPESGPGITPEAVRREDGAWLIDGLMPVEELVEILDAGALTDEERRNCRTVGGLVMNELGQIPVAGSIVNWRNLKIEVVDMDGRRVDKVLVAAAPTDNLAGEDQLPESSM